MRKTMLYTATTRTPLGAVLLVSNGKALTGVFTGKDKVPLGAVLMRRGNNPVLKEAKIQLKEFFAGKRKRFTVPLDLTGTPFQKKVWKALTTIPYGKTVSYRQLARMVGKPRAARAVGNANRENPVCIIVPCHRVIATGGSIGGYAGGLARKRWLLAHEKASARAGTKQKGS